MQVGQLMAGVGIGLGLAAGSIGGWSAFQRGQASQSLAQVQPQAQVQPLAQPAQPVAQTIAQTIAQTTVTLTQAENDYLYDLSQALQAVEQRRLSDPERLAIGRQVAGWLESGSDYWQIRSQFDQAYGSAVAGDYAQNRDAYIKFATERLAPAFVATLSVPPQVIIKTKTRYVETPAQPQIVEVPGKTQVIRDVIHVPEPYPVPVPVEPHPHHPRPEPHYPHPDSHLSPDETVQSPEQPERPDRPVQRPPVAELPDPELPDPELPDPELPTAPQPERPSSVQPPSSTIEVGATTTEEATY